MNEYIPLLATLLGSIPSQGTSVAVLGGIDPQQSLINDGIHPASQSYQGTQGNQENMPMPNPMG